MKFLLLFILTNLALANNCKIRTVDYTESWMSENMKSSLTNLGYTFSNDYTIEESGYAIEFKLQTVGICDDCQRGPNRFATFSLYKGGETYFKKPILEVSANSHKKSFDELKEIVERKVLKRGRLSKKLPSCL